MTQNPPPPGDEPNVPLGKNPGQQKPSQGGQYPPPGGYQPPQGGQYPPPGSYQPPRGGQYPPQGGYQPPQGGQQYPPPPQGGYQSPQGGFPPPPPPGQYAPQGGGYPVGGGFGPPQLSVGAALSYAWEKYKANAGAWILIVILSAVAGWVVNFLFSGFQTGYDVDGGSAALTVLGVMVAFLVSTLFKAAQTRGSLDELDGIRPAIGAFFNLKNLGAVFIIAILILIASVIGFILLIIPFFIVTFVTWYALTLAIDKQQDAITAMKSSFELTTNNIGPLLLLALANTGLLALGIITCGLGMLVALPITVISSNYAYRVLTGGTVSPPV